MLTDPQKATLKTAIQATPALNALYVAGDLAGLAAGCNAQASPAFTVWKTNVSITQIGDNIVGTELAGLTSLNVTRLQCIADYSEAGVNPSLTDRRAFFDDVFSGAGGQQTRAKLLILWKRLATFTEKLFATGTGSDAAPATLTFEGAVTVADLVGL